MLRLVVCSIYSVGFWTVAGIVSRNADTFPVELLLVYTGSLGVILGLIKDKGEPDPEEKQ